MTLVALARVLSLSDCAEPAWWVGVRLAQAPLVAIRPVRLRELRRARLSVASRWSILAKPCSAVRTASRW